MLDITSPTKPYDLPLDRRFWNVNVPASQWSEDCPEFLLGLSPKDQGIISTPDSDFQYLSWDGVKKLIAHNQPELFQRQPSELRRYKRYVHQLIRVHGSVLSFIQNQRLRWNTISPSGDEPFTNETDLKILYNDWPYGIDPDITHLVVWTKFLIDEDPQTGDLTPDARTMVEAFVTTTFCSQKVNDCGVKRSDLVWFKNWRSLKSVHALEHFHVMLYKAPPKFLERITGGDRPMSEQFNN